MITLVLNTEETVEHTLVVDYSTDRDCVVYPFNELLEANNTQVRIRFTQAVSEATIDDPEETLVLRNVILFQGWVRQTEQTVSMTQLRNVMIGYGAGDETVGGLNCFVGNDTNVLRGQSNIIIGHDTRLLSGTNNIIIGHGVSYADKNDTLAIGSLIEGDFTNPSLRMNASVEVTHALNVGGVVNISSDSITDGFLSVARGNLDTGNVSVTGESIKAPAFTDGFLSVARGNLDTGNVSVTGESISAPAFTDGFLKITHGQLQIPRDNVVLYFENGNFVYRLQDKVYRLMSEEV